MFQVQGAVSSIGPEVNLNPLGEKELRCSQLPLVDNQAKNSEVILHSPQIYQVLLLSYSPYLYPLLPLRCPCHSPVSCPHHLLLELIEIAFFYMQFVPWFPTLGNHHGVPKNAGPITPFSCLKPFSGSLCL